jgi:uridine kinase
MKRQELLEQISAQIMETQKPHVLRVAVDGVDCSGKTIFADELAKYIQIKGRHVIRASIDGFHNPCQIRHEMGKDSPEGFYLKSFNYDDLIKKLLKPLGPGGDRKYLTSVYDFRTEKRIEEKILTAPENCILIFEGIFLMRPELRDYWDFKIWLDVDFHTVLERAVKRDMYLFGDEDKIKEKYLKRYIPGQQIYIKKFNPAGIADIVINNVIPERPLIIK